MGVSPPFVFWRVWIIVGFYVILGEENVYFFDEGKGAMSVFQAVSDKFFNPFTGKNRELYFSCITELIEKSKEIPVLYE